MSGSAVNASAGDSGVTAPGHSPGELAELLSHFNEVAANLQATHETLRAEVARLESELRNANRALRRSRELAALGEMAAGIAHEVRNPLGCIRLYAEVLDADLADRPEQRDVARRIGEAVRGLDRVVGDVLAFARRLELRPQRVRAIELFEKAVSACAPAFGPDAADVRLPSGRACGREIVCDPGLVHQALVNVVRNAFEAVEGRGERVVTLEFASRSVRASDGSRRPMTGLVVRDSGPGFDDDVRRRMFNPFFTTRAAGTGLGLSIVHRIVDAHGGEVRVRNHEGGGGVVELLLPDLDCAGDGEMSGAGAAAGAGEHDAPGPHDPASTSTSTSMAQGGGR